jgi:hypothetical protein
VNIVRNLGWNDGVNYALNVSSDSMFGGVQINGQDNNNIYQRVGDLTIASPSTNSIIFKTSYATWDAMRLNTSGISMNTSLHVSGIAILNNSTTCLSSFTVSGTAILNNATSCISFLNVSGTATINNQISCLSSLNISGAYNLGPLYINDSIGTQNTFLQIGTKGNISTIRGSVYTTFRMFRKCIRYTHKTIQWCRCILQSKL